MFADPTFGNAVLSRAAEAGQFWLNAEALQGIHHILVAVSTTVEDQVFWCGLVGEGFAQLLDYPFARRMSGHVEVQNAPPTVLDEKEAVQHAEGQGGHSEEARGSNLLTMVPQESQPTLRRPGLRGAFRIQRRTVRSEISKPSIFSLAS